MAEDEASEADLSGRLATVLEEIRDVMEKRKQRIEELRQEITEIENDNDDLEKTILSCWTASVELHLVCFIIYYSMALDS